MVLTVILLNSAAAAASAPASSTTQLTATTIDGIDCPTIKTPRLRCANLSDPTDWSRPKGAKTLLGLAMVPTRNSSGKIGSLSLSSGGSGGTAIPELRTTDGTGLFWFIDENFDTFDITAMDPRGLGESTPIQCSSDISSERVSLLPQDEASFTAVLDHFKALGDGCEKRTGSLANHLDSVSVAREFEAARAGLRQDVKFNYIDLSYGSVFGTAYAELFPEKIRAVVFDGITDHSQDQTYAILTGYQTYEKVLTLFFEWYEKDQSCAMNSLYTNSTQILANLWDALIDKADKKSITAPVCQGVCQPDVTGEDILFNAQEFLLFKTKLHASFPFAIAVEWTTLGEGFYQAIFKNHASYLSASLMGSSVDSDAYAIPLSCQDWNYTARSLPEILSLQQVAHSIAKHTASEP